MKRSISALMCVAIAAVLLVGCGGGTRKFKGGEVLKDREGWQDDNTYRMIVVGSWNRDQYYPEGASAEEGKKAAPSIVLQQNAKRSATVESMRNFREKMGAYIKSKTGVEDSKLIGDVIQSSLEGVTIAPTCLEESYTARFDCEALFEFKAEGLKKIIDEAAAKVLAKAKSGAGGGM